MNGDHGVRCKNNLIVGLDVALRGKQSVPLEIGVKTTKNRELKDLKLNVY
jgi:hypothetical protein